MRIILFALSNFFVFAAAAMITDLLFSGRDRRFQFLAILCFAAVEIIWIELATGLAGKLTFPAVTFAAAGGFAFILLIWLIIKRPDCDLRFFLKRILLVPVFLLVGLGLGLIAGKSGLQGTHFCGDDLFYHGPAVAQWYQQADVSILKCLYNGYNYNGYKWFNAELLSLWFLMPFGQDGLVLLAGLFWLVLTGTAAVTVMMTLGIDRRWYGLVVFLIFCTDVILYQATLTFSAVDLVGPAMLLSAAAILLYEIYRPGEKQWPSILLAGLCAGFACGSKVPFVLPSVILAVWLFFAFRATIGIRFGNAVLFVCCAILTGGFWYVRNMVLTGNPLFPAQAGPFDGPLTRQMQFGTSIAGYIVQSGFNGSVILEILRLHLAWPPGMAIMSSAGYIAGLVFLCQDKRNRKTIGLLLLLSVLMMTSYVFMPFSAQNDVGGQLAIALRFIISPFLMGLLLFSLALNIRHRSRWLIYGIYLVGVTTAFLSSPNAIKTLFGIAAIAGLIGFYCYRKPLPSIVFFPGLPASILVGGLAGLAMMFSIQQDRTDRRFFNDPMTGLNLGRCWQQLDTLPNGSRVMICGALGYCSYPAFGRHYQLCPWPNIPADQSYQPPHMLWKTSPERLAGWPRPAESDTASWILGLIQNQADYIVVQRFPNQPWPEAYAILSVSTCAESVDQGDCWAIWKIKKQ